MQKYDLAEKALKSLSLAEDFEKDNDITRAIEYYQKAADLIKQSGLMENRVDDINKIIENLKKHLNIETMYQQVDSQEQKDQLQLQAFNAIQKAKKLEARHELEEAIQYYTSAIKQLRQAGWNEEQLKNLTLKLRALEQRPERQYLARERKQESVERADSQVKMRSGKIQAEEGFLGEKAVEEKIHDENIKAFQLKKKREEGLQTQAFEYLDEAKKQESAEDYLKAILNYQKAMELLNSIGWNLQTQKIGEIIAVLKRKIQEGKSVEVQETSSSEVSLENGEAKSIEMESHERFREHTILEFEEKRKKEEEIQNNAFKLIDSANKQERAEQFDEAVKNLKEAIELLKIVGWNDYIDPIVIQINQIREKKIQAEQRKEMERKEHERREREEKIVTSTMNENIEKTMDDLETLTDNITSMMEESKKGITIREQQRKENIKVRAAEFSKSVGDLMDLKKEFVEELRKAKMVEKDKVEIIKEKKDRKQLDEIAKMLDEVSKKK